MTDELWNKGLARANRGHISTFMRHQNLTEPNMILIGEAAAMRELRTHRPFVGPAGKLIRGLFSRQMESDYIEWIEYMEHA